MKSVIYSPFVFVFYAGVLMLVLKGFYKVSTYFAFKFGFSILLKDSVVVYLASSGVRIKIPIGHNSGMN
jgi:hypothetical protein